MMLPKPAKPEPNRNLIQRRDAEIAEISAEKTKPGGVKAQIHALALGGSAAKGGTKRADFAELVLGFLCAFLCVLCVSALNKPFSLGPEFP
jgi:hypothetical protein